MADTPTPAQSDSDTGETVSERLSRLTPREREVAELMATGQSGNKIAVTLGISAIAVATYRARIARKLRAESQAQCLELIRHARVQPE